MKKSGGAIQVKAHIRNGKKVKSYVRRNHGTFVRRSNENANARGKLYIGNNTIDDMRIALGGGNSKVNLQRKYGIITKRTLINVNARKKLISVKNPKISDYRKALTV